MPGDDTAQIEVTDDGEGNYVISEDAIKLLPEEWQKEIFARAEAGQQVLEKAQNELNQLARLSNSIFHMSILKHIRDRLVAYRFEADINAFYELDMLTTAFVATYVRIFDGGIGSGFSKASLGEEFHETHDEIIDIRNKRYAHIDEHRSVKNEMEVQEENGAFTVHMSATYGYYIGGSSKWPKIVDFLDELFSQRADKLIKRLQDRTGREWSLAKMPSVSSESVSVTEIVED